MAFTVCSTRVFRRRLTVEDHTVVSPSPGRSLGPSARRAVLGRVTILAGTSLVAAAVLAIRLWNTSLGFTDEPAWLAKALRLPAAWSRYLDLPPITYWALAAIAVGCGLGAISRYCTAGRDRRRPREPLPAALSTSTPAVVLTALAPALAIALFATVRRLDCSSSRVVGPWLALVIAISIVLLLSDRRQGKGLRPRLGRWESASMVAATAAAFAFLAVIGSSWRFSFVGDEFAFFDYARGIVNNGLLSFDWLDGMGVYDDNPKTMSVYQAAWMVLLGPTSLAWRLSATFLTVICLPPFYLILRHLAGRSGGPARAAAVVGCIVFFSSEQIIVWAVQGKIHIAAMPSMVFGLCLYFAARARASALLYWLAGLACGAAFHFSLLGVAAAVPAVGLLIGIDAFQQLIRERRLSLRILVPGLIFVAGVAILAAPYIVQIDELRYAADTKMVHYEGIDGVSARARGAMIGFLQPLSFNAGNHFLWGNVLDPTSAFLVCMALMPAAGRRSIGLLQTIVVLATCALMTSGFSQYTYPSVTRTFLIMVPAAMLASFGFSTVAGLGFQTPRRRRLVAVAGLCLATGTAVAVFNWVKLWHFNPYQRRKNWHIVAMAEIEGASPRDPIAMVFPHPDPKSYLLEKMTAMYGYGDRTLFVKDDERGLEVLDDRLRTTGVQRVLARTEESQSEPLKILCAEHNVPLGFITGARLSPPPQSRFLESTLAIIRRFERRGPDAG